MKKQILLALRGIALGLFLSPAIAQTSSLIPAFVVANDTIAPVSLVTTPRPEPPRSLNPRRIPVKAGDSIMVSATVLDNSPHSASFFKRLAKAVVPSLAIGIAGKSPKATFGEGYADNSATFGASVAVIPGAADLLKKRGLSKTFVGLAVYDTLGQPVEVVADFMTKAARKDWETLTVNYAVERDGFVNLMGSYDPLNVATLADNPGYWINFGLRKKNSKNVKDALSGAGEPNSGYDTTASRICTNWYLCTADYSYCEYLFSQCQPDEGEKSSGNDNTNDGSVGGVQVESSGPDSRPCKECQTRARQEFEANQRLIRYALFTGIAGCQIVGLKTFAEANAVGVLANLLPGIGTGTLELIATVAALSADITCLVGVALSYDALDKTQNNSYHKDLDNCAATVCK
jgi:hypothetical protein